MLTMAHSLIERVSYSFVSLTHGPQGQVAVIWKDNFRIKYRLVSSLCTRCEIALRWMPENLTNEQSVLVPSGTKPLPEQESFWLCLNMKIVFPGYFHFKDKTSL